MTVNRLAHLFTPYTMPRRPKPPRVALGTDIPPAMLEAVRDFSAASGLPINRVVEEALQQYLTRKHWPIGKEDE